MGYVDVENLTQQISKLRANGSEAAMEEAHRLEREAEDQNPDALGNPAVESDSGVLPTGSTLVEGKPVETPQAPELPSEPQVAEQPPTAEERLGTSTGIEEGK